MFSEKDVKKMMGDLVSTESSIYSLQEEKKEIDTRLKVLKGEKDEIRSSIALFMNEKGFSIYNDDKFGEISIRKSPDKYTIENEDDLMSILKEYDKVDDFCETSVKINKRLLNGFFKELRNCNSLPECVCIERGDESVVFKPSSSFVSSKKTKENSVPSEKNDDNFSMEEWDSI